MLIKISVEVDEADEYADPDHAMGVTEEAFVRLNEGKDGGPTPLGWLGEVVDVEKVT